MIEARFLVLSSWLKMGIENKWMQNDARRTKFARLAEPEATMERRTKNNQAPPERYAQARERRTGGLSAAFTLMELLVVISIIALLLGIIVPSYFSIREKAKYTKAKVTVKNLETAFKAYLDQYRTWPAAAFGAAGAAKEMDEDVVKILSGENVGGANSASIAFYEFESTNTANGALDAWYDPYNPTPQTRYWVQVDHDYNNQINPAVGPVLYRTVIVWSPGADRTNYTPDDVKSWD